ncbi:hypothetical protein [Streptomyces sp. NEAU-W12]|uniref:hypothetical protein n=1 Tax=Streptomyces sp. NEAU-W12 TaxID=2994668 RepID=UPI00224B33B3|nr:hypothetical protein [Streptomyces sp. NEAU-W12]MCX2922944.1 hypothetical protein [Streptomyces sp. NEAU-W12]
MSTQVCVIWGGTVRHEGGQETLGRGLQHFEQAIRQGHDKDTFSFMGVRGAAPLANGS